MMIVRNGHSILLTPEEMRKAYRELQLLYDMENVASYAGVHLTDEQELNQLLADTELMKRIAEAYRMYEDDCVDTNWLDNMLYAFNDCYHTTD